MKRAIIAAVLLALATSVASFADKHPLAALNFVVIKDANGKPVRNASVVLHPVKKNGDQAQGGMELKTDSEGKTGIDGIPYGKLRVQVIAPHFKTFGQDYDVNQPEMQIEIKLQAPADQYSIYH